MNRSVVLLPGILLALVCADCAPGAGADYASLRQDAVERIDAFKKQAAQAKERGIDVSRERVTIITAELFLKYADWDAAHPDELETAIAAWWRVKDRAAEIAPAMAENELRQIIEIVEKGERELSSVVKRPDSRRASPRFDMTALEAKDGYYHYQGRPVFPSTFTWMPDDPLLAEAYGEIGGTYIAPPNLAEDGRVSVRYEPREPDGPLGDVFFGHSKMADWVVEKHPEILTGKRHFTGYDIDHPVTREVWSKLLAGLVPKVAGRNTTKGGYLLANEPHWFSGTDEWDTGPVSEYAHAKFRVWLKKRHGSIKTLNDLWKTTFASFEDVLIEVPVDTALRGTPLWYDWCRFNMSRVTGWFTFLKNEVRRHDPLAVTHIKLIPDHFSGGKRSHGLDFETLLRLQDMIGCDAKVVNKPLWNAEDDRSDRYSMLWRGLSMPYDFFRPVSPDEVLFDSEFHGLSTSHWRDEEMSAEYVRCVYWLAHLHGMSMNQTWYWGRQENGAPLNKDTKGFHGSNLTSPRVMDAMGRTMKELNAFAPEIVALATQPKRVRIFYSETSAIQDPEYMDRVYKAYRDLYHSGVPVGFVTGRMIAEASDLTQWPAIVVAHANRVTTEEVEALARYGKIGGRLVVIGKDSLERDEYGRRLKDDLRGTPKSSVSLAELGLAPDVSLSEKNQLGEPGCVWRTAPCEGGWLMLVVNLGKGEAAVTIDAEACHDMINNDEHPATFTMKPLDVKLLRVVEPAH